MTGRLARLLPLMLGLVLSAGAWAAPWEFSPAIPVTRVHGPGIFHHLESAGRKNVAVAGSRVAVAWSDN
ncbi:MAG TPA: hypothetical protein VKA14_08285, partial [Gammaproteobacteria bacterium]|nr:hypothetical protein [Gammaproteobacteria bacterium]